MARSDDTVLEVEGLYVDYPTERGTVHAVRGVDLSIAKGEIVGLVGESGCGKTATLLSIIGLLPHPGRVVGGRVTLGGRDLTLLSRRELRSIRGSRISMIFQDPMSTLNPAHKIRDQISEVLEVHGLWKASPHAYDDSYLVKLLQEVGIPSPEQVLKRYPHELSGGMQQRVMIAIALSCRPELILADEPTTALDVTIQAQILELLRSVNESHGTSILLVTHDLAVASQFCDRIAVMYAGEIVEEGPANQVLASPLHPYTQGLLNCIPRFNKGAPLVPIPGAVADLTEDIEGCAFYPRCLRKTAICAGETRIDLETPDGVRRVRCLNYVRPVYEEVPADSETGLVVDENKNVLF